MLGRLGALGRSLAAPSVAGGKPVARAMTHYPVKRLVGVPTSELKYNNIRTSPFRLGLLAKLVRRLWVPEALAQLKFSPKRYAPTVALCVERCAKRAGIEHELVPEELYLERVFVVNGPHLKRLKIMGRGQTGIVRKRSGHLVVVCAKVDFEKKIAEASNRRQKEKWMERQKVAIESRKEILGPFWETGIKAAVAAKKAVAKETSVAEQTTDAPKGTPPPQLPPAAPA